MYFVGQSCHKYIFPKHNMALKMFSHQTKYLLKASVLCINRNFSTPALTKVSFENGVQKITMCDLKTRNSLSISMMQNLIENIKNEQNNSELRVVILSGDGPIFSAGHNLKELVPELSRKQHEEVFNKASQLMMSIIDSPVPIIAKVDGLAAAAGCQLVAQCDLAICTEESKFSTPGANFGIFCSTPGIAISRCIPKMSALHMLFTGLPVSAEEAKQIGLVSKVCANDALDKDLDEIIKAIKSKSRSVVELGKRFYYKQIQCDIKQAYDLGAIQMVDNINLQDGKEGIKSFVEKRKAHWSHSFAK